MRDGTHHVSSFVGAIERLREGANRTHVLMRNDGPNAANVANWKKAENTPDAHVTGVLHTGFEQNGNKGIELSGGISLGQHGSTQQVIDPNSSTPMTFPSTAADPVSASSISLYGCNSYDLGSDSLGIDFAGVQGNVDLSTLDAAAQGGANALGGQAGVDADNAAIENSQYPDDTGANVE